MNILQSTVERLLYLLLLLCFTATIIVGIIAYQDGQYIKRQQQIFHDNGDSNLRIIKQNQAAETLTVKTYIACLLMISPQSSPDSIKIQEQICFDKAPKIIK